MIVQVLRPCDLHCTNLLEPCYLCNYSGVAHVTSMLDLVWRTCDRHDRMGVSVTSCACQPMCCGRVNNMIDKASWTSDRHDRMVFRSCHAHYYHILQPCDPHDGQVLSPCDSHATQVLAPYDPHCSRSNVPAMWSTWWARDANVRACSMAFGGRRHPNKLSVYVRPCDLAMDGGLQMPNSCMASVDPLRTCEPRVCVKPCDPHVGRGM